ncbi:MAG: sigma-70 family RNA polymerase sigma factor [Bdellovibrionales bacterium]|nr:sigma-70 family RNA polymerase sigma factor [Bdellovibrionales bacterium]
MKLFGKLPVLPLVKSDEDLMLLVMQNHPEARKAFDALYGKYKRPIMSYIYSMTLNQDHSEDLTQETFLKLYRARDSYQPTAKFSTYLWTIAKHTTYDHLRRKKERLYSNDSHLLDESTDKTIDQHAIVMDESPLADERLTQQVDEARVRECLSRLSPRAKQIVNLRIFSEESYEAISRITSEPEGTVKTILHRSKASLVECFKKGQT